MDSCGSYGIGRMQYDKQRGERTGRFARHNYPARYYSSSRKRTVRRLCEEGLGDRQLGESGFYHVATDLFGCPCPNGILRG